ncbi:hypothetical protein STEG23_014594, partial [Scotinomys teguina]
EVNKPSGVPAAAAVSCPHRHNGLGAHPNRSFLTLFLPGILSQQTAPPSSTCTSYVTSCYLVTKKENVLAQLPIALHDISAQSQSQSCADVSHGLIQISWELSTVGDLVFPNSHPLEPQLATVYYAQSGLAMRCLGGICPQLWLPVSPTSGALSSREPLRSLVASGLTGFLLLMPGGFRFTWRERERERAEEMAQQLRAEETQPQYYFVDFACDLFGDTVPGEM